MSEKKGIFKGLHCNLFCFFRKGNRYIYFILDWTKPRTAGVTIVMVLALAIVVHVVLMLVYYLRTRIYMSCCQQKNILPISSIASTPTTEQPTATISMVFGHENKVFDLASETMRRNKNYDKVNTNR